MAGDGALQRSIKLAVVERREVRHVEIEVRQCLGTQLLAPGIGVDAVLGVVVQVVGGVSHSFGSTSRGK